MERGISHSKYEGNVRSSSSVVDREISFGSDLRKKSEAISYNFDFLNPYTQDLLINAQLRGFETEKVYLNNPTYQFLLESRGNGNLEKALASRDKRGRPKAQRIAWYFVCTDATGPEVARLFHYNSPDGAISFFRRFVKKVYDLSDDLTKEKYPKEKINTKRKLSQRVKETFSSNKFLENNEDENLELEFYRLADSLGYESKRLFVGGKSGKFLKLAEETGLIQDVKYEVSPEIWDKYYPIFCAYSYTNVPLDDIADFFGYSDRDSISRNVSKFIDMIYQYVPNETKKRFPRKQIRPKRYLKANKISETVEGSKNDQLVSLVSNGLKYREMDDKLEISITDVGSRITRLRKRGLI